MPDSRRVNPCLFIALTLKKIYIPVRPSSEYITSYLAQAFMVQQNTSNAFWLGGNSSITITFNKIRNSNWHKLVSLFHVVECNWSVLTMAMFNQFEILSCSLYWLIGPFSWLLWSGQPHISTKSPRFTFFLLVNKIRARNKMSQFLLKLMAAPRNNGNI